MVTPEQENTSVAPVAATEVTPAVTPSQDTSPTVFDGDTKDTPRTPLLKPSNGSCSVYYVCGVSLFFSFFFFFFLFFFFLFFFDFLFFGQFHHLVLDIAIQFLFRHSFL